MIARKKTGSALPLAALVILVCALVLALAGCATPATERYYRIAYPANAAGDISDAAGVQYELILGSVQIPESINRPQLVLQKSATEASITDDQRWVAPLDEQIAQAVIANLRAQLPGAWLASSTTGLAASGQVLPRYNLKIQVEQLLILSGDKVVLEANWMLQDSSRKLVKRERSVIHVTMSGAGYDPVAPAVSEAVRQLSVAVAKGIQAARPS